MSGFGRLRADLVVAWQLVGGWRQPQLGTSRGPLHRPVASADVDAAAVGRGTCGSTRPTSPVGPDRPLNWA
jgi:hypothetical protein